MKHSLHKVWDGSLLITDNVYSGWYGAVIVAVCTSSDGLDVVVAPDRNSGTGDLSWVSQNH